ncbi:hypothetical protein FHP05_13520 [Cerasibacillus terrae]|uniref:Uncharacterized protein n=1 Tax=Cerasibacillus terrae TaxID=2498845 RepID=A0A5C8NH46_9BACI|nr:hypothetical protein [Cerasibacillus terrae]TXL61099.1 hypothetical protein FHP05_13520 [Cerasibacillus terrae]
MMEDIDKKLNKLIKLYMTKGVQPSELADNIFLSHYKRISFTKRDNSIVGELLFEEELGSVKFDVILRYYFQGNTVNVIQEESIHGINEIWNRETKETDLINEIVELMRKYYKPGNITRFINSLPNDLATKLKNYYEKTA